MKNNNKELAIGEKITSFDQLKEGMLVDFKVKSRVKDAIIVSNKGWYAVHDCEDSSGAQPSKEKMFGKKYGWGLRNVGMGDVFEGNYSDMIFRGWYKKEEKSEKPVEKPMEKNSYKIGDIVKDHFDGVKAEVIGVYQLPND